MIIADIRYEIFRDRIDQELSYLNQKLHNMLDIDMTVSVGGNVVVAILGFSYADSICLTMDTDWNIVLQRTRANGITLDEKGLSSGYSAAKFITITNAPNYKKLEGMGKQVGGSLLIPIEFIPLAGVGAGAELNLIPDSDEHKMYYGATISEISGIFPGAEVHMETGNTVTLINVKELLADYFENSIKSIFNK